MFGLYGSKSVGSLPNVRPDLSLNPKQVVDSLRKKNGLPDIRVVISAVDKASKPAGNRAPDSRHQLVQQCISYIDQNPGENRIVDNQLKAHLTALISPPESAGASTLMAGRASLAATPVAEGSLRDSIKIRDYKSSSIVHGKSKHAVNKATEYPKMATEIFVQYLSGKSGKERAVFDRAAKLGQAILVAQPPEATADLQVAFNQAIVRIGNLESAPTLLAGIHPGNSPEQLSEFFLHAMGDHVSKALVDMGPISASFDSVAAQNILTVAAGKKQFFKDIQRGVTINDKVVTDKSASRAQAYVQSLDPPVQKFIYLFANQQSVAALVAAGDLSLQELLGDTINNSGVRVIPMNDEHSGASYDIHENDGAVSLDIPARIGVMPMGMTDLSPIQIGVATLHMELGVETVTVTFVPDAHTR